MQHRIQEAVAGIVFPAPSIVPAAIASIIVRPLILVIVVAPVMALVILQVAGLHIFALRKWGRVHLLMLVYAGICWYRKPAFESAITTSLRKCSMHKFNTLKRHDCLFHQIVRWCNLIDLFQ